MESPISNSDLKQVGAQIDHILQTITNQFVEKLDQRNEVIHSLQSELQQKETQLRLLPDLQKQADEKRLEEFRANALEKQNEALRIENEKLKLTVEQLSQPEPQKSFWGWFVGSK